MRQLLFTNEVTLEDERVMKLDYSLTEERTDNDSKVPYYGIQITKYLDNDTEMDEITGISSCKEDVVLILRKLCQFQVTPISMVEIVDELMNELVVTGVA